MDQGIITKLNPHDVPRAEGPKPSIGRIVVYHRSEGNDTPAIILGVSPDEPFTVHIRCFDLLDAHRECKHGSNTGEWSWPARV